MTFGIGTLLIGLALLTVVAVLAMMPLLEPKTPPAQPASRRDALEAERAAIVRSIRDLDFDYRTHKLNEEDYHAMRRALVQRGADVLRELDALERLAPPARSNHAANGAGADGVRDDDAAVDAEIETVVARLRQGAASSTDGARADKVHRAGAVCPACGRPVLPDDRFCAKCGQPLRAQT